MLTCFLYHIYSKTKPFYLLVGHANYLIGIFMNFSKTSRRELKKCGNIILLTSLLIIGLEGQS